RVVTVCACCAGTSDLETSRRTCSGLARPRRCRGFTGVPLSHYGHGRIRPGAGLTPSGRAGPYVTAAIFEFVDSRHAQSQACCNLCGGRYQCANGAPTMNRSILLAAVCASALIAAPVASAKTLIFCSEGSPENFYPGVNTTGTSFDGAEPIYN